MQSLAVPARALFLLAICAAAGAQNDEQSVLTEIAHDTALRMTTDNPYAHYSLDGHVRDSSGNGLHGRNAEATPTDDRFGRKGRAMFLDGINDFLILPIDITPYPLKDLTMMAWIKPGGKFSETFIITHDNGGYDRTISGKEADDGTVYFDAFAGDGERLSVGANPDENGWYFVAVVYEQGRGTVRLHVNGQQETKLGKCGDGYEEIRVGANMHKLEFYRGAIDEIRIYDKALSPQAIDYLYREQPEAAE